MSSNSYPPMNLPVLQPRPSQQPYHRLVANGRGRNMTRPSWMNGDQFATLLGGRPSEFSAPPETSDRDTPPPLQAAILTRVIILRNAFDPKRLIKNKYLSDSDSASDDRSGVRTFPDIERQFLSLCAQYGFVRLVFFTSVVLSSF
jgi:hypothetical protein